MRNLVCICVQPGSIVSQAEFHGDGISVLECRYVYVWYHGWACRIYELAPAVLNHPPWRLLLLMLPPPSLQLFSTALCSPHSVPSDVFSRREGQQTPLRGDSLGFMQVWPQAGRPGSAMLLAGVQALPSLSISSSSLSLGKFLLNWKNSRSVLPSLHHRIAGVQVLVACYT